jgi:beta-galactosidase
MNKDSYEPVRALPAPGGYDLRWMGFQVPGNPWNTPPLVFGHRLIYRTKVDVPAEAAARGFTLHFSGTHWIASVFVNGQFAGAHKGVWVPWDLDITRFVRAGQVNEIAVAIKGSYYAFDAGARRDLKHSANRPLERREDTMWIAPIYPSGKGDGDGYIYGIANPVTLICAGRAYTEDVFVKPSVGKKELVADVTVRNPDDKPCFVEVRCEAVNDADGQVEQTFPPVKIEVAPESSATASVRGPWANPKLWWPVPNPALYRLRTTLVRGGRPADVHEQLFGFREVTIKDTGLYLNGVRRNLWCWVDPTGRGGAATPEEWVRRWREQGNRFIRFGSDLSIGDLMPCREDRLEFYDRQGVAGRLCTMIDGMFGSYRLMVDDGSGERGNRVRHRAVWDNFREHMEQAAKAYRNHPSILLYQAENELVYINGMNRYGSSLDEIEAAMAEVVEAGRAIDPTRPYTVGGAGDLSGRLEINAPHYPTAAEDLYPQNAYDTRQYATKIERWPWDRRKPWHIGEDSFANHLAYGALVSGDAVFQSQNAAREAKAKYLRMLYGGYRWQGVHAFFPWDRLPEFDDSKKIFSDLCAIPRKQTARLYAGRRNELLFKVMNDSLTRNPVTFEWSYTAGGKVVASEKLRLDIEPGFGEERTLVIVAPETKARLDGELVLKVTQDGSAPYEDRRSVPVLPAVRGLTAADKVYVLDRSGALSAWLGQAGLAFQPIESLEAAKDATGLLLVGGDTLTPDEAYGTGLLAFAARGGRAVCLEQENPPSGAALPVPLRTTTRMSGFVHPQALGTPLMEDLGRDDLIDWAGDHPTAKNVHQSPTEGGRSLALCGSGLDRSPLVEVPCGKGVIVICQLRAAAKLGIDPAADILVRNLVRIYGAYAPASGRLALVSPGNARLTDKVRATGVLCEPAADLAAALDPARYRAVVIDATDAAMADLVKQAGRASAFRKAGGWIVLNGLGPGGMDAFNRFVGGAYSLRPFRLERVTMRDTGHQLAATLGTRDVALYSPEVIQHSTCWVSPDVFSAVIDAGTDFAPFTLPPGAPDDPFDYKPTKDDKDPYNFVNGMTADDHWRYSRQIWVEEAGAAPLVFRLRKPDTVASVAIWNLNSYGAFTEADLVFDGRTNAAVRAELPNDTAVATIRLPAPVDVRESIAIVPRTWSLKGRRNKEGAEVRLCGINLVQFFRPEGAASKAVALDSVGGLVAFPEGEGGTLLCQIRFLKDEPKEANAAAKLRLLGTLLQNMGVGSRAAETVAVPGVNVRFHTINLQEFGTVYLDAKRGAKAWFGEAGKDLRMLPRGEQVFAGVTYHITDYATAPTPDVIVLGGKGIKGGVNTPGSLRDVEPAVKGIPVGRKSDLLYFLHTAHVSRPITEEEMGRLADRKKPFVPPAVLTYVLHYADGQTAEIPIVLGQGIDHWIKKEALPLPGAQIGWAKPMEELGGERAVLYSVQVRNPRPDVAIETIDAVRSDPRAVPAVLGISLGDLVK